MGKDPEWAMFTIDASKFPKLGVESVGVIRQYCGTMGKVANCQSGVFLGYVGELAHGLSNSWLYNPEDWFGKEFEIRWEKMGLPEDLVFAPSPGSPLGRTV